MTKVKILHGPSNCLEHIQICGCDHGFGRSKTLINLFIYNGISIVHPVELPT